jgi:hypothetical protein
MRCPPALRGFMYWAAITVLGIAVAIFGIKCQVGGMHRDKEESVSTQSNEPVSGKMRLKAYLAEAYDAKLLQLEDERKKAEAHLHDINREYMRVSKLKDNVDHNLNRANEQDLRSLHYMFFGMSE